MILPALNIYIDGVFNMNVRIPLAVDKINSVLFKITEGENKWGEFSYFLSIIGDINGDGYDEVAVGALDYPDYQKPSGKVYIYSYKQLDGIDDHGFQNCQNGFQLYQNYPNPFNSTTTISYNLIATSHVRLTIFNCTGQKINTLTSEIQQPGFYHIDWNGTDEKGEIVSSGIYFCQINLQQVYSSGNIYVNRKKLISIK